MELWVREGSESLRSRSGRNQKLMSGGEQVVNAGLREHSVRRWRVAWSGRGEEEGER